jgi:hypothetical protein
MKIDVNVDNYVDAETAFQFDRVAFMAGGVNTWVHNRQPTPIDQQNVIRMNRDTLYSFAIVDISAGATLTVPDAGSRYLTVMAVNEDCYINRIIHDAGDYPLAVEELDTPFVGLVARTLVDPSDPDDMSVVSALQDGLGITAAAAQPWAHPDYDKDSYEATKKPLLQLAEGIRDTKNMFGTKDDVDPVRFLLGAAAGFGGLPEKEAFYIVKTEGRPQGRYRLTVKDVPVDGFWSVTVYNKDGYFEKNKYDSYSVNSVTATPSADGSVTVNFGTEPDGTDNFLYVMEGWNYTVRLYRPRPSVLDGTWTFPEPQPVQQ